MTQSDAADDGLFDGSPLFKLQHSIGLKAPTYPRSLQWACLAVLVGWVPLLILSAIEGTLFLPQKGFLSDIAVHARSLIAVPILILAEILTGRRLSGIARHFVEAGLVSHADAGRFGEAVASTRRLRDSNFVDMLVTALSYVIVITLLVSIPVESLPAWHWSGTAIVGSHSLAGWWHGLVSLPILTVLLLGWLWRLFLWGRFLWLVSRLNLRLVPAHPDRAAGLMFVGTSLQAICVIALAISVIVAGTVANRVLYDGMPLTAARYTLLGLVCTNLIIFCSPFTVFAEKLFQTRLRGIIEYGSLAGRVGRRFERKWFDRTADYDSALEAPDFSATTDLYQIAANVYEMRTLPLGLKGVLPLVGASIAPFVPVAFLALPFDVIFSNVAGLLF